MQLFVKGAHFYEMPRNSDESSSSDDQGIGGGRTVNSGDYSVCVQQPNVDPIYLVFGCREETDKWLYFLKLASRDGELYGTPFEVIIQRLMVIDGHPGMCTFVDINNHYYR
jgi:hypothetical protein